MVDIKEENFYDVYPQAKELITQNYADGPIVLPGLTLDLDVTAYKFLASHNALALVTARDAKKLVGYHLSLVKCHIHFATIPFGFSDSYVVHRDYRNQGIFGMMVALSEHIWLKRGAKVAQMEMRGDVTPLLKRGYVADGTILVKKLEA